MLFRMVSFKSLGCLFFLILASETWSQSSSSDTWIQIAPSNQESQNKLFLNDIIAPLGTIEGEHKMVLLIINKTYGDTSRKSVFDNLPFLDFSIWEPFISKYDGQSKTVEMIYGAGSRSNLENVDRSKAFILTSDDFWVDVLNKNGLLSPASMLKRSLRLFYSVLPYKVFQ